MRNRNTGALTMKKIIVGLLLFLCVTLSVYAQDYDDPFTEDINEGAIGSGYDDPFTEDINEAAIGSGYDDPFTEGVNEGAWH